jgi:hypothetical protein
MEVSPVPEHRQPSPAIADSALTPERLARLRQLYEAATPGPWLTAPWDPKTVMVEGWVRSGQPPYPSFVGPFGIFHAGSEEDAALAAAALSALPALLDALEHERGEVDSWIRTYLDAARRFDSLCMDLFRRIAGGASLADVVDLVGDYMDGCDRVDDESIAAFNAAKTAAGGRRGSVSVPETDQTETAS